MQLKRIYPKADHEAIVRERIMALNNGGINSSFYASLKYHLEKSEVDLITTADGKPRTVDHTQVEWNRAINQIKVRLKAAYRRDVLDGIDGDVSRVLKDLKKDYAEFPGLIDTAKNFAREKGWADGKGLKP